MKAAAFKQQNQMAIIEVLQPHPGPGTSMIANTWPARTISPLSTAIVLR